MSKFCNCPRCGERTFEKLSGYAHCPNCLYSEDYYEDSESLFYKAIRAANELTCENIGAQVISLENVVKFPKRKKDDQPQFAQIIQLGAGA